ncbi:MAG: CDP-alcohol phosphatidyltransferase [Chloroflexota bacterium]|nr:MAG: CDP-alcohol phosphatidyltransferase [Chloroflexota bacterium]
MATLESHKRVNDILLGPLERPVLRWLAAHMPAWINPDILTGIGVVGAVITFFGYVLSFFDRNFLWLASLGFVINWFGDSLDGTLARYRNIQRPIYGFYVDHSVDAFSIMVVFTGMGLSPYISFGIACMALVGYLLMVILVCLDTCVRGEFKISYSKIGPTEMRVIAILLNTAMYFFGFPSLQIASFKIMIFDIFIFGIAAGLIGLFISSSIQQARRLSKIDRGPTELSPAD